MERYDAESEADHSHHTIRLVDAHLTSSTDASSYPPILRSPAAADSSAPTVSLSDLSLCPGRDAVSISPSMCFVNLLPVGTPIGQDAASNAAVEPLIPVAVGPNTGLLRTYKVLIVGEAGVGKSNLMHRYCHNQYNPALPSTIGVEFCSREICIPSGPVGETERVVVQLWDTAGQECHAGVISNAFYRNAVGAIVVYDVTRPDSLLSVPRWVARVKELALEDCVCVVVGAKLDLLTSKTTAEFSTTAVSLEVLQEDADRISHAMGYRNFMTSALTGEGVLETFTHLILAVNAVQTAPPCRDGIHAGPDGALQSSCLGGSSEHGVKMWTTAVTLPLLQRNATGDSQSPSHFDGVRACTASALPSKVASTSVEGGRTNAVPVSGFGQQSPPLRFRKSLDLRGFGSCGTGLSEPASSPASGGAWGC